MKTTQTRMHVSLYVRDINKTIQFYNSFFSMEPTKVKHAYAKYVLDNPNLVISFVENAERVQSNFGHLGFQVESEAKLNEALWKAKGENLVASEEVGTNCCYAKQDKFWAEDPDGIQWEVYYFHEDSDFNDPKYELSEATACCTPADKQKVSLSDLTPAANCC